MLTSSESPPRAQPVAQPDVLRERLAQALRGSYEIERELGRGGMGVVYLARELSLDRHVAIKALPPELARDPETRTRFLREARTAAQLYHPNIVPVYRADEADGVAYFAMAYVEGETLADRIRARGPHPPADAVRILREVAFALAYAHARGVVHRDVKPENILLERASGRAIVTDFGIARDDRADALTRDGYMLGTAHYMSPEQASGAPLDGRSDLYALGVVGYLLLSGRLPFTESNAAALLVAHATRIPPSLASVSPVPAALGAIIDRCLAKNPDDRYATGEALAEALVDPALLETRDQTPALPEMLNDEQAIAFWRRAAELQSEASRRLERRFSERADDLPSDPVTPEGYRLSHVRQAAIEAGIAPEYVALALSELPAQAVADAPLDLSGRQQRVAERVLRAHARTIAVSRVIEADPREVLAAIGQVFPAHPFGLSPRDTVGGHPLDGGVIVFDVPKMTWTEDVTDVMYFRYFLGAVNARQLRVTLRARPGMPRSTEVAIHVDLRDKIRRASRRVLPVSAAASVVGTAATFAGAATLLALAPLLAVAPAVVAGALLGAATVGGYGWSYRYEVRCARDQLTKLLDSTAAAARTAAMFGAAPQPPGRPNAGGGGWPPLLGG